MTRRVIGVMTGTSLDGMDLAAVDVTARGLTMEVALITHRAADLGDLAGPLRAAAAQTALTAGALAGLARDFGVLLGERIAALAAETGPPDFVAVHGQTIHHDPPSSWQLLNAAPIAAAVGCPVVFDLRQADLAAGGKGAPITPLADWILFRAAGRRAIVNLGGFCNVTILPATGDRGGIGAIRGFDVCACNQVLDAVARAALDAPMDRDGAAAAAGRIDAEARITLSSLLDRQREAGRSLGTRDEVGRWIEAQRGRMDGPDLAATAGAAIAGTIAAALTAHRVDEIIVAGGGARNRALLETLRAASPVPLHDSDAQGIPLEAREAVAMAILGALCADGVPITLPQVTGCRRPAPLAGTWVNAPFSRGS